MIVLDGLFLEEISLQFLHLLIKPLIELTQHIEITAKPAIKRLLSQSINDKNVHDEQ